MKIRIHKESLPEMFIVVAIGLYPILFHVVTFIEKTFGLVEYHNFILFILRIILIVPFVPYIIVFFEKSDLVVFGIVISIYYLSAYLNPSTREYIALSQFEFIFLIFPYFYLGVLISKAKIHIENIIPFLRVYSVLLLILMVRNHRINGGVSTEMLGRAYLILPTLMYLTYNWLKKKQRIDILFIAICLLQLLFSAARGPILLYIVFIIEMAIIYKNWKASIGSFIIFLCLAITPIRNKILHTAFSFSSSMGYSSKLLRLLLTHRITDDSGRSEIYRAVDEMISKSPILGNGLYSDRIATKSIGWIAVRNEGLGMYSHSLYRELFCEFGYILGAIILIGIVLLLINALLKIDSEKKIFLIVLMTVYFGKLFISSSYLIESGFFELMGLCVGIYRSFPLVKLLDKKSRRIV